MTENFHDIFIRVYKNLTNDHHMSDLSAFCEASKIAKDCMVINGTWDEHRDDVFCHAPYIPLIICGPR